MGDRVGYILAGRNLRQTGQFRGEQIGCCWLRADDLTLDFVRWKKSMLVGYPNGTVARKEGSPQDQYRNRCKG